MPEAKVCGGTHSMCQISLTQMTEQGRHVFRAPSPEAPMVKNAKVFE